MSLKNKLVNTLSSKDMALETNRSGLWPNLLPGVKFWLYYLTWLYFLVWEAGISTYLTKLWELRKCALYIYRAAHYGFFVYKHGTPSPLVHVFPLGLILALGFDMPPPPQKQHHHHPGNLLHSYSFNGTWYIYIVFILATKYSSCVANYIRKNFLIWYGHPVPTN